MILKVDAGFEQIQGDSSVETRNYPRLKVHIEASKEELAFIRDKDKDTFDRLCQIIKFTASECSKRVQIY